MTHKIIELTLENEGDRLDKALANAMPDVSRMQWQRLIKGKQVLVDGKAQKSSYRIGGGEKVVATIPEAVESELLPEDIPLDIRYEDSDILIVNKPAGMVVHPGTGHESGTLVNALLGYCSDLAGIGDTKRPGIVHRLDKDTSGLLVVAKNDAAMQYLQAQFKERTVGKKYIALIHGEMQPSSALVDAPIGRDPRFRKRMAVIAVGSPRSRSAKSRPAQTHYKTLQTFAEYSLLECTLHTGRTHQIRVHLSYVGHPIVGDHVYGRRQQPLLSFRHFLHAAILELKRPSDQTTIITRAELPVELTKTLKKIQDIDTNQAMSSES